METEPPDTDLFNTQESRRERSTRRSRRRRRIALGIVLGLVAVAGATYGAYHLLARNGSGDETATTTSASPADDVTSGDASGATSSAASTSSISSAASTTAANLPPQPLAVTTSPEETDLTIRLQDGTSLTARTPFSQAVPGGTISVELARSGYNATIRELTLDRPTELKIWLDPEGQLLQSMVRFKCGLNPYQVVFSPDDAELWVSFQGSSGLGVYDPVTGDKLGAVQTGDKGTAGIVFTRDGRTAYASQMETGLVYEIDRATRAVRRRLPTESTWTKGLALSPDEKTLYAANWAGDDVSEIDLATGTLLRRIPTVATPSDLYATPDGRTLYVAGYEDGDIERVDLSTATGTVILETGGAMGDMVADESLSLLYVGDAVNNAIYTVDLLTDEVKKLAETDQRPATLALSPDGKVLYVANRGMADPGSPYAEGPEWGTVLAFDTVSGAVLDAIVGGNQSTGLDVSSDGTLLAFSDFLDNKIRVYTIPAYEELSGGDGGRADRRFDDKTKD